MRILVVDDNLCARCWIEEALLTLGHEADAVDTGQQAIEAVSGRGYDMVLLDLELPGMDGVKTARAIRLAVGSGRRPSLVLTSARDELELESLCAAGDFDAYLAKPIGLRALEHLLAMDDPPSPAPAPRPASAGSWDLHAELDLAQIEELLLIDPEGELLRDVVDLFEERGRELVREIDSGQGDLEAAIHELRGCAATVGARKLVECCQAPVPTRALAPIFQEILEKIRIVQGVSCSPR